MTEQLLATVPRCDGGEIRVYRKLFKGRPYIELSTWSPSTEGAHCIRSINLRRYEVRPVILGLMQALKTLGVLLRPDEALEGEVR